MKKPIHKVVMTEGERQIIQQLLQEYDIETAEDIQDESMTFLLKGINLVFYGLFNLSSFYGDFILSSHFYGHSILQSFLMLFSNFSLKKSWLKFVLFVFSISVMPVFMRSFVFTIRINFGHSYTNQINRLI